MSRWLPPVALGAVLAMLAIGAVLAFGSPPAPRAEVADALAAELRCPDCQGLSVADSPSAAGAEMRRQIDEMLAAGATPDDVRAHFVARYGEWILLAPTAPAVWLLPYLAVGLAAGALIAWLAWRQARPTSRVVPGGGGRGVGVSEEARRRVHDEAEALDA